jgi:septal ring factor EnvC (AmiA/AmiB activator)
MNTFGKNAMVTSSSSSSSNAMTTIAKPVTSAASSVSASASSASAFDKQIQKWIEIDNKLKKINSEIKSMREMKNDLEASIMDVVNHKKLLNTTVSTMDGRLRFIETKTTNPLSLTFIEQCLHEIIPNSSQVQHILKYIKDKREIKVNPEIKRYYNN